MHTTDDDTAMSPTDTQPFHTICVMAACIRSGKMGKKDKVWTESIQEATTGYALMLASQQAIADDLNALLESLQGQPIPEVKRAPDITPSPNV